MVQYLLLRCADAARCGRQARPSVAQGVVRWRRLLESDHLIPLYVLLDLLAPSKPARRATFPSVSRSARALSGIEARTEHENQIFFHERQVVLPRITELISTALGHGPIALVLALREVG